MYGYGFVFPPTLLPFYGLGGGGGQGGCMFIKFIRILLDKYHVTLKYQETINKIKNES